jgi:hypothetical protein
MISERRSANADVRCTLQAWMTAFLVALIISWSAATAQIVVSPDQSTDTETIRTQIKAQRAKEDADEKNGPHERPWDRDVNGKRPWERVDKSH